MAIAQKNAELQRFTGFSNISSKMDESKYAQVSSSHSVETNLYKSLQFLSDFSARTLSKIETHLDTNNATEAWILLAIVAPNIQGHNPERVSKLLLANLKYDMVSDF